MRSKFEDLLAEYVDPHVDEEFGSRFTLVPMKRTPNGRPVPDASRQMIEAVGVFENPPIERGLQLGNRRLQNANDTRTLAPSNQPTLSVLISIFEDPNDHPRQGDVIMRGDHNYDVVNVHDNGTGRYILDLVRTNRVFQADD